MMIPVKRILIITSIFFVVMSLGFNFLLLDTIIDMKEESGTPNFSEIPEVQQEEVFADQASSIETDQLLIVITYNGMILLITILIGLVLIFLYKRILNSPDLQRLINTSLQLAGFNAKISTVGRMWEIVQDGYLELHEDQQFTLRYNLPAEIPTKTSPLNPSLYGLQSKGEEVVTTNMRPDQLQLTLLSFRRFVNMVEDFTDINYT